MALQYTRIDPTVLQTRSFLDHFGREKINDSHLADLVSKSISLGAEQQKYRF